MSYDSFETVKVAVLFRELPVESSPAPTVSTVPTVKVSLRAKGEVNVARIALDELGISPTQADLIGLAKGRTAERRERRFRVRPKRTMDYEYVVKPELKGEIELKRNSATLHFLQRIRDESHRFAIAFHRSLRKKEALHSELEDLRGVGKKRAQALLRHFGSLQRVREAGLDELKAMPGLPAPTAERIFAAYHAEEAPPESLPAAGSGEAADEPAGTSVA